jgi:hypothetical protein
MALFAALGAAACGAGEPLPAYPPPMAPADEAVGGDLDSLDLEEEVPADDESAPTDEEAPEAPPAPQDEPVEAP